MELDDIRKLDIASILTMLALELDSNDSNQFIGNGHRISFKGEKWYDHNTQHGGGGAIDLIMHVNKLTFKQAVNYLNNKPLSQIAPTPTTKHKTPREKATKPPFPVDSNLHAIKAYLTDKRGLNADLVQWCIDKGLIYADARFNCVFRYGSNGAELRGIGSKQWRSVYGTIEQGFILPAKQATGVSVVECAIDALSYRQLHKTVITVSIAGNGNHKVLNQACLIAKSKNIPVIASFDNDKGGDIAAELLKEFAIENNIPMLTDKPIFKKDWNEELRHLKALQRYRDTVLDRLD